MFVSRMIKMGGSVPGCAQQAGRAYQARSGPVSEFRSHCLFDDGPRTHSAANGVRLLTVESLRTTGSHDVPEFRCRTDVGP